jgi:large subunit ribosomal protein L15
VAKLKVTQVRGTAGKPRRQRDTIRALGLRRIRHVGIKGYLARNPKRLGYEGGQMPLVRRVPKKKGFTPRDPEQWAVVNVERLGRRFDADATVTPEAMAEAGLVRGRLPVKVLGRGDLDRALTVQAHAFSTSARQKIEQAGGKAEVLGG